MNIINTSKYTKHLSPGKFEGESPATEYFYEQMLNGDGETLWIETGESDDFDSPCADLFHINADESEAFNLPIGFWFMLRYDSQGFVYGSSHASREEVEKAFHSWLGLLLNTSMILKIERAYEKLDEELGI
jgi:hypothetical protein